MTSNIDPTQPVQGSAYTQSVRDNFQVAHDEITTLQAQVASLQGTAGVSSLVVAKMTNVNLSIAGDQLITMPSIGLGYIIKDIYITNVDPATTISTGYIGFYTGPNGTGNCLWQAGVDLVAPRGAQRAHTAGFDFNWWIQPTMYLNMNGPSTAPAIVNVYIIGFML